MQDCDSGTRQKNNRHLRPTWKQWVNVI